MFPCIHCRYFSACNTIDQHNKMQKWDLVLEKYFVTQGGYFRIGTAVALGMEIKYENLLFCHGISGNNRDKDITIRK